MKYASYRAVLFDLDGTLLDTIDDLAESMNVSLRSMGFGVHDISAYKLMIGEGARNLAWHALPEEIRDDEEVVSECMRRMKEEYLQRWFIKTKPYDGIPELLDELAKKAFSLAVLSNKPHFFVELNVQRYLSKWQFKSVIGAKDGVPVKPDPFSALKIASDLKMRPEEFLFLGDSGIDMQTARAAGMYPVGALWGFRYEEELRSNGAQLLLSKPEELLKYIN